MLVTHENKYKIFRENLLPKRKISENIIIKEALHGRSSYSYGGTPTIPSGNIIITMTFEQRTLFLSLLKKTENNKQEEKDNELSEQNACIDRERMHFWVFESGGLMAIAG